MALLITYDLNNETRRPPIVAKIKGIGSWARLSESSYAVATSMSPDQVHAQLKPLLDGDDHIYIVTLSHPWTGYGPRDVNDWLAQNL